MIIIKMGMIIDYTQACLFYAPHLLHKTWEAGKVAFIFQFFFIEKKVAVILVIMEIILTDQTYYW